MDRLQELLLQHQCDGSLPETYDFVSTSDRAFDATPAAIEQYGYWTIYTALWDLQSQAVDTQGLAPVQVCWKEHGVDPLCFHQRTSGEIKVMLLSEYQTARISPTNRGTSELSPTFSGDQLSS